MKTLLVDTSYLIYRSYFAYPNFLSQGKHTGAIYGFIKTTMYLAKEYGIDRLIFAVDLPGKTWRHEKYDDYKAGRPEMDVQMREQIPVILDWAKSVTPYVFSKSGYEADDMICSAIKSDGESDFYIMSSDRDLYQMFTEPNIRFLKGKQGTYLEYGHDQFRAEFGVEPEQYVDYKALVGDGSDNIKGVPGIGPKTAAKLLTSIGSLKELYRVMNWDAPADFRDGTVSAELDAFVANSKNHDLLNKIYENKDSLELAYTLSGLNTVQLDLGGDGYNFDAGKELYIKYDFKSILGTAGKKSDKTKTTVQSQEDGALF
jgi:DNA polymerase I